MRERVEVGAFELLELAVFEDPGGDFVLRSARPSRMSCAVEMALPLPYLMGCGEAHLVEEDVAELLGGVDVEAVAGAGVDALGEVVDGDGEAGGHFAEEGGVDADAVLLHAEEDGD